MISIFEIKDLDYVIFGKDKKLEKSKIKQKLDEFESNELIHKEKKKPPQPDKNQLQKMFAHYKNE